MTQTASSASSTASKKSGPTDFGPASKTLQENEMSNLPALRDNLEKMKSEFARALPGHVTPERFVRTAQTAIALTRNIDKADPKSLLAACSKAAADGLILDGREAALVIDYRGEAQYRPMMRGLLKLAYQSGMIASISVQVAYDVDDFEYVLGDEERIVHRRNMTEAGKPIAVYAIAKLKSGEVIREVMTVAQINAIRDRSDGWKAFSAGKIKSTPWSTDWEEMARKTVFRRISKYLPSSVDSDRLQAAAERIDEDYTFDDAKPVAEPVKQHGGAAAILKDVTPPQPAPDQDRAAISNGDEYDRETGEIIDVEPETVEPF